MERVVKPKIDSSAARREDVLKVAKLTAKQAFEKRKYAAILSVLHAMQKRKC